MSTTTSDIAAGIPFFNDTSLGSLNYHKSWPRSASPCEMVPLWAGEFTSHADWVNFATKRLVGTTGTHGVDAKAICVDALGRRCLGGADMARARDEDAFPVRYFFECLPAPSPWQPIETAPKDAPFGTWIIGCRAGQPESVGPVTWRNGFWFQTDGERWIENWLTHWMPLPSAPSQIEEGKDNG